MLENKKKLVLNMKKVNEMEDQTSSFIAN